MTEKHEHKNGSTEEVKAIPVKPDQSSMFLSNALKSSFMLLKVIMIILVIAFIVSGFKIIEPYEKALVLTFGGISGQGETRVTDSGLKWVWPSPIQELIRIPVEKKMTLNVDDFWYAEYYKDKLPQGPTDTSRIMPTLNPMMDGYCLTRSVVEGAKTGTDYNIVHTKWQLTYQITQPELFYTNVFVDFEKIQTGQNYADLIEDSVETMLKSLLDNATVKTMVNYTIDDVLYGKVGSVTNDVKRNLQNSLNKIESGITIVTAQLTGLEPPRQVAPSFRVSIDAANAKEVLVSKAKAHYQQTLNETAGPVAEDILEALEKYSYDSTDLDQLWDRMAGRSQSIISEAQEYRTKVVENAKANAEYFQSLLPEYRKRPKLVVQKIWQDTIQTVLNNSDEQIIIEPGQNINNREIRLMLSRNPAVKKGEQKEK